MNEHGYSSKTAKKLRAADIFVWKINDNFAGGVPDFWFSAANDLWCEAKYLKALPKRDTTIVNLGLRENQKIWLRREHKKGRTVCVLVGCGEGDLNWLFWGVDWDRDIDTAEMRRTARPYNEIIEELKERLHGT